MIKAFGSRHVTPLTEEVVLSQGQQLVRHHQAIGRLQEPHRGAVQNGGTEKTLLVHTPQHRRSTGIHHHSGRGDTVREKGV